MSASNQRKRTCWNCGQSGHMLPQCPKEFNRDAVNENRRRFQESRQQRNQSDQQNRGQQQQQRKKKSALSIDRTKVCPFLVRVFPSNQAHHEEVEYDGGRVPSNEIHVYAWRNFTARELIDEVKEQMSIAGATRFSLANVYPNRNGRYVLRPIVQLHALKEEAQDESTFDELGVEPGDFIDLAIY
jgi:histone deacetylase complex subunit SAP18